MFECAQLHRFSGHFQPLLIRSISATSAARSGDCRGFGSLPAGPGPRSNASLGPHGLRSADGRNVDKLLHAPIEQPCVNELQVNIG
jgi:hypothetical protein